MNTNAPASSEAPTPPGGMTGDVALTAGLVAVLGLAALGVYWIGGRVDPPRPTIDVHAVQGKSMLEVGAANPAEADLPPVVIDEPGTATIDLPPAVAPPADTTNGDDSYAAVNFDTLGGFLYEDPNDEVRELKPGELAMADQIPATVRALHKKKVAVQGYMVPLKTKNGSVQSFILVKNHLLCCFGQYPRMNEWVYARVTSPDGVEFYNQELVTVYGTIEVGEEVKDGVVISLYRMTVERVLGPLDL